MRPAHLQILHNVATPANAQCSNPCSIRTRMQIRPVNYLGQEVRRSMGLHVERLEIQQQTGATHELTAM